MIHCFIFHSSQDKDRTFTSYKDRTFTPAFTAMKDELINKLIGGISIHQYIDTTVSKTRLMYRHCKVVGL
eukprot:UN11773